MKVSYLVVLLVAVGALFQTRAAGAYTISVDCEFNPLPPPSIPYQNVNCTYAWAPGGNPMDTYGTVDVTLQYWPSGGTPEVKDHQSVPVISLAAAPSPLTYFIVCSNIPGSFREYMTGTLFRLVVMGEDVNLVQVDTKSDAEFTFIYDPPSPTCP